MAEYLIQDTTLDAIADAINAKTGGTSAMTPAQMAAAISAITTGIEPRVYTWDQRPSLVAAFLDEVTYDPSDYATSRIADYAPAIDVVSNYKPVGKAVASAAGTLNRNGYEIAAGAGGTTVYSDIPGRDTPFTVRNSSGITQAGVLRPTGALRWIKTPQAVNCRDLGGWACDGGTVKYGMLFRGGEVTAADRDVLVNQCGVRHELNLRGDEIPMKTASPLGADIGYSQFEQYVWYSLANRKIWRKMLRVVFDCAAKNEPVYFHCTAGADRTGTLACVIEALLGMPQSDIDKDYELTCFYSGTADDNRARRRNEADWTGLIGALNAVTGSTFRDKAVNFAASLGFTAAEINAFRAAVIDGTPETVTPTVATYSVTRVLTDVTIDNTANAVVQGDSYEAELTPRADYYIDSVHITMDGVDVSGYYAGGTINIPSVTGDIVITATAVPGIVPIVNLIDTIGIAANTRISTSDGGNRTGATGYAAIGAEKTADKLLRIDAGDVIRISGVTVPASQDTMCALAFFNAGASGNPTTSTYWHQGIRTFSSLVFTYGDIVTITSNRADTVYIRMSVKCSDTSAVVVTRNQEIE